MIRPSKGRVIEQKYAPTGGTRCDQILLLIFKEDWRRREIGKRIGEPVLQHHCLRVDGDDRVSMAAGRRTLTDSDKNASVTSERRGTHRFARIGLPGNHFSICIRITYPERP